MIKGIGTDIIEIERIKAAIEKYGSRFLNRIFSKHEQEYCLSKKSPWVHLAGRFAAKEAIAKALGTGIRKGISWLDIEIDHDSRGKPVVKLSENLMKMMNHPTLLISISHCRSYSTSFAIWEDLAK